MGEQPILAPSSRLPASILVGLLLLGTAPETLGANPPTTRITWRAVCVDPVFRSEGVALADVNRDGLPDVIASNTASDEVTVRINLGGGTFANPVAYFVGTYPTVVRSADLGRDSTTKGMGVSCSGGGQQSAAQT